MGVKESENSVKRGTKELMLMDSFEGVQAVSVVGVEGEDAKVQLIRMLQDHREDEVEDGAVHRGALWLLQQL